MDEPLIGLWPERLLVLWPSLAPPAFILLLLSHPDGGASALLHVNAEVRCSP